MRTVFTAIALVIVVLWGWANSGPYIALVHG
jgi:hypothetical protein